eukprot:COSAG01_NODE_2977_length_6764_cov_17.259865_1_plen_748_part_00
MGDLAAWLDAIHKTCATLLGPLDDDYGIDVVQDLVNLEPAHIDRLVDMLKMNPGKKFRKALEALTLDAALSDDATGAGPRLIAEAVPPVKPAEINLHTVERLVSDDVDAPEPELLPSASPTARASAATRTGFPNGKGFGSMRFDGVVPGYAQEVKQGMNELGADMNIINMKGGGDVDLAVQEGILAADAFIVFGSKKYGEDTGNAACTYYESKFAQSQKKKIILIRMIPFDEEFQFPQAKFMFGLNMLELPWMLGTPMPPDLPRQVVEAMGICAPTSPEVEPEDGALEAALAAERAHLQAQLQAQAAVQTAKLREQHAQLQAEQAQALMAHGEQKAQLEAQAAQLQRQESELRQKSEALQQRERAVAAKHKAEEEAANVILAQAQGKEAQAAQIEKDGHQATQERVCTFTSGPGGYGIIVSKTGTVKSYSVKNGVSAAQDAGLPIGCSIVRIQGVLVSSKVEIVKQLKMVTMGKAVQFSYVIPAQEPRLIAEPTQLEAEPMLEPEPMPEPQSEPSSLKHVVFTLTKAGNGFGITCTDRCEVTNVAEGSVAQAAGMPHGCTIVKVRGTDVHSKAQVVALLKSAGTKPVPFTCSIDTSVEEPMRCRVHREAILAPKGGRPKKVFIVTTSGRGMRLGIAHRAFAEFETLRKAMIKANAQGAATIANLDFPKSAWLWSAEDRSPQLEAWLNATLKIDMSELVMHEDLRVFLSLCPEYDGVLNVKEQPIDAYKPEHVFSVQAKGAVGWMLVR